ncbi:FHA domain-containing protein [Pseudarthrobacter sp. N5]|uniref:FHA domain-containing protein n=1 Tax=Pseudarthrobacter sp. N5 TaxID=3418416 RepID=UPI003CE98607
MRTPDMLASSYVPGTWLGVVRSRTAVILRPDAPQELVHSLWELLGTGPEIHEVLHAVTRGFGLSLTQIPWFGIVDFQDSLRVFLRGDIDLTVQLPTGPVELNGRDVTTWTERWLAVPEWYSLSVPGEAAGNSKLPLGEGVVLLQGLKVAVTASTSAAGTRAAPEVTPAAGANAASAHGSSAHGSSEHGVSEHGASADTMMSIGDEEQVPAEQRDATEAPAVREQAAVPEQAAPLEPSAVPRSELTGSYDHLWEKTVVRTIEDAAVREPEEDPGHESAEQDPLPVDAGDSPSGDSPAGKAAPGGTDPGNMGGADELVSADSPEPQNDAGTTSGLIDSVPWHSTGGDSPRQWTPSTSASPPAAGQTAATLSLAPTELWQATPAQHSDGDGDHDGQTIMKGDLGGMVAHPAPVRPAETDPAGPLVLARVCAHGHANPPTNSKCVSCGLALASDAVQVPRPRLGRMRVSTGHIIDLDQSLVIGRQPSVSRVQGGVMPRLVQVASPSGDISRSHVEVRLEGWHVMLCDLKATNGTVLVREGQQPRRLAQNEMAILLDGDIAELGDDISLRFEEIL